MMSLRSKVIVTVLLINLLIFGVLAYLVPGDLSNQKQRELAARSDLFNLFYALAAAIPESDSQAPDLSSILDWPHWDSFDDALVMEGRVARTYAPDNIETGVIQPVAVGLFFNPKGRYSRDPDFNDLASKQIVQAIDRRQVIETDTAIAVPLIRQVGGKQEIWGGGYFVLKESERPILSTQGIIILTIASMLLLAFVTFFTISKLVLRPVEILADASARVSAGDLSVSLPIPSQKDELAELVASFDEMVAKLRNHQGELKHEVEIATEKASKAERELLTAQRLAAMGTLAAGIAHEINNPLGGMMNAIRALEKKDLSVEKRAEYLEMVISGLERIRTTVSRVLLVSPRSGEKGRVAVNRAVQAAKMYVGHRLESENIQFSLQIPEALISVEGSAGEIEQLFINLFLNSIDAILAKRTQDLSFQGGLITVKVRQENGQVVISVEDDGCGMNPEMLARAIDPFFSTKDVGKGTGLGLSIVYSVIKGLGGSMELWSEVGKGFRVQFQLPAIA